MHDQIIQDPLFRYPAVFLFKKIFYELLFYADRELVSVETQRVQLVEKHEFAVQQRVLRQHRRAGVGAFSDQVFQKGRRARVQIHNSFKIPWIDLLSGPRRPRTFHRPDVIRHAEGKHRFDLLAYGDAVRVFFQQKRQIRRCIIQDLSQLLTMELIGDNAVFTAGQPRKERLLLDLCIQRRERMFRRRFWKYRFKKRTEVLLFAGLVAALRSIAAVGGIVIRILRVFIEYVPVSIRRRFSHIGFQRTETGVVLVILADFRVAEILFSAAHFRKTRRVKNLFRCKQQFRPLTESR